MLCAHRVTARATLPSGKLEPSTRDVWWLAAPLMVVTIVMAILYGVVATGIYGVQAVSVEVFRVNAMVKYGLEHMHLFRLPPLTIVTHA